MKVDLIVVFLCSIYGYCYSSYIKRLKNRHKPNGDDVGYRAANTVEVPVWKSAFDPLDWTPSARSYLEDWSYTWPNAEVPYYIENSISEMLRWKILQAVDFFNRKTCIKWLPRKPFDKNYVTFRGGPLPCMSQIGCVGGGQTINLNDACIMDTGHEMMHAMGFIHEQMRLDRDCYVEIRQDMLNSNMNYRHYTNLPTDQTWPYDYHSVMHYPMLFGEDRIIKGKGPYYKDYYIGPDYDVMMTDLDLWKLNTMYCGKPHYCHIYPDVCDQFYYYEKTCIPDYLRDLYESFYDYYN